MFNTEEIRKVLFGAQKQSMRTNDAIVSFMSEYLKGLNESSVQEAIKKEAERLLDVENNSYTLADKLFMEYVLGCVAVSEISRGAKGKVEYRTVGDKGKYVFDFIPKSGTDVSQEFIDKYNYSHSEEGEKATSLEDEAWKLIHNICESVPPTRRKEMPEDDALAAILLAKEYYYLK